MPATRKSPARKTSVRKVPRKTTRKAPARKWSAAVTEHSDALDLQPSLFRKSARAIAQSLKRSAEESRRRKTTPYRSAMSMLTFYENRAGRNLSSAQRKKLDSAKDELRIAFGRRPRAA